MIIDPDPKRLKSLKAAQNLEDQLATSVQVMKDFLIDHPEFLTENAKRFIKRTLHDLKDAENMIGKSISKYDKGGFGSYDFTR